MVLLESGPVDNTLEGQPGHREAKKRVGVLHRVDGRCTMRCIYVC